MKILILEANPQEDLSLDKEIRDIISVINESSDRSKFRIKDGAAVRKDQLCDLLLSLEAEEPKDDPIIVHFCGHGTGEKGLVFEDRHGNSDLVGTKALTDFFALFENRIACVVINACYADVQAKAINQHIKYVIGMKQEITDRAAIAFSTGFYRALGFGRSFEDAFKFGKSAIQLAIDDSSKSRNVIAKEIRKLVPVDEVSETIISQEDLNPILLIKNNESDGKLSYEEKSSFLILKDKQRQELIEILQQVFTEDEIKTICLNNQQKFRGNLYDRVEGNTAEAKFSSLVDYLIRKNLIESFLDICLRNEINQQSKLNEFYQKNKVIMIKA